MKYLVLSAIALALLAVACSGRDDEEPTPTPEASPTSAAASPTSSPTSQATVPAGTLVPSRALLIEAATGKVTTLYESPTEAAHAARFDGNVVELSVSGGARRFNLDGTPAAAPPAPACTFPQGGVEIAGKKYSDVPRCGVFSPDGRWMTYERPADEVTLPNGARVPSWDQWVLDLESGATRELQKGLLHCGGCDGRYGPRWSPTSRYVVYAEFGGTGRRFLSDVTSGATRALGEGNEITRAPEWAPTGNRIVYSVAATGSAAVLEDLDRGLTGQLPIAWPVGFDPSGLYMYSPAWDEDPKTTGKTTTVITVSTLSTVATLSGASPSWSVWRSNDTTLVLGPRGVVAALQGATSCEGTSITVGSAPPGCIDDGVSGVVNPAGSFVAVAKAVGVTGPAHGPGFQTTQLTRYDIELFDVTTGLIRGGLSDVLSWDSQPPVMAWNEAGTHLLVLAPSATGL